MVLGDYLRRRFNLTDKEKERRKAKPVPPDAHSVDRPPKAFHTPPPGKVRIEDKED